MCPLDYRYMSYLEIPDGSSDSANFPLGFSPLPSSFIARKTIGLLGFIGRGRSIWSPPFVWLYELDIFPIAL